jgi:3'-phosphoadenosine 5'-phosphosulfate sulfotransferase (PAPS reductase)/FAD synthetase
VNPSLRTIGALGFAAMSLDGARAAEPGTRIDARIAGTRTTLSASPRKDRF